VHRRQAEIEFIGVGTMGLHIADLVLEILSLLDVMAKTITHGGGFGAGQTAGKV
jgi:hypothetical protein